jgi:tetratricopeptide (TPR) repeat protein
MKLCRHRGAACRGRREFALGASLILRPQTCRSREEPVPPRKRKRAAGAGDGLLERERELDALEARLEAAREGRGGLVVVEGAAGIGKSRLLDAARGLAEPAGFRALSGKATELEHDFPFGYARQLFEDAVRAATPKQREALFAGAARHAEAVFSAEADDRAEPDGGHRVLHGLYWLLVNLSQDGPLLVAADDAHWSDPPSLRFLIYLASRLDGLPVLVVLASRPGEPGAEETLLDELLAARDAERLRPDALSREAVTSLIAARLGDPDPGFAEACWDATKGNPFLLAELTREVADEEIAPDDAGAERIRVLGPQTISRTVLVRIARLGDVEVKVAEAVAVIGDATRVGQAARFAEISERDAARAADDLVRIGILRPDRRLSFAHPVVRTAIYQDLAPRERAALHRKAADILAEDGAPAGKVAGHLLFTDPGGDAEVVEVLRSAARSALSRGAPEAAIPLLRRALEEPPPDAERVPVLRELGRAETRAGDPRAGERLGQAMELAPDPLVRAEVARELSTAIVHAGRQAEAVELLDRTADAVRADDPELARHLEAELLFLATLDEALYRAQRARFGSLEEIGGDSPGERALLAVLAYRSMLEGEPADRTISLAQRAMGDGRLLEEAAPDSPLFWLVAASLVLAGADELAEPMIEAGVTDAESRGSLIGSALAYRVRAMLRLARGEVANAEVDSRRLARGGANRAVARTRERHASLGRCAGRAR